MTEVGFYLDTDGGAEVLKEIAADTIAAIADAIAAQAGEDAGVEQTVTDRARSTVKIPADQQAKDGVLTRAAAAAGLEVTQRTPRRRKSKKAEE